MINDNILGLLYKYTVEVIHVKILDMKCDNLAHKPLVKKRVRVTLR